MGKRIKEKKLAVFINIDSQFLPAGLLSMTEEDTNVIVSKFAYGLKYLNRPNAIEIDPVSLSIVNKQNVRGMELLPVEGLALFGGIRDAAPDSWGRRVIEARLKAPLNSLPESAYLLEAGSERIGALDIRESIESHPSAHPKSTIHRLEYMMDAAARIELGLPVPVQLEDIFDAGSGMGGMRPKATVEDEDGVLWLAKFPSRNEALNVPCIEAATMRLAAKAKLDVPTVRTENLGGKTVMLIRRFDRALVGGKQYRHHLVSALTMLGCDETESRSKSYWDIADKIRMYTPAAHVKNNQKELFGRMVFNILVTNDDDHLRNHAFLWDGEYKGWKLSPLFDVMPHPVVGFERYLHLGVGSQGRVATLDNALSGYSRFGITLHDAEKIIDRIWRVVRQWKNYFEEFGVPENEIKKIAPAFRHIDDVMTPGCN
jgi:serine/threonine-protein kinase HipA